MVFVGLLISFLCINPVRAYLYCKNETKLCFKSTHRHIACDKKQLVSPVDIPERIQYPITKKIRKIILDAHNSYRNKIACGNITNNDGKAYPTAARMQKLSWDFELEYLATLHSGHCMMKHDECHNTERFPISGQNIGYFWSTTACGIKTINVVKEMVSQFYMEHKLGEPQSSIIEGSSYKQVTRFVVLVNDKVDKVGCALIACYQPMDFVTEVRKKQTYLLTCNYSYDYIKKKPTYLDGKIGAKCSDFNKKKEGNSCLCV